MLLIDELDRADEEFEGFLLELLGGLPDHHPRNWAHTRRLILRSSSLRPTGPARFHDALKRRLPLLLDRLPRLPKRDADYLQQGTGRPPAGWRSR